jgi:beta-glucanase (GH16 family)
VKVFSVQDLIRGVAIAAITTSAQLHINFPYFNFHLFGAKDAMQTQQTKLKLALPSEFAATPSWQEDFTGQANGPLSTDKWHFESGNNDGWGNKEVEQYGSDQSNVRIENGNLVIEANKTDDGVYHSARIASQGNLDFTYGKLDIVAEVPKGEGIWPALWLWPTDSKYSPDDVGPRGEDWLANGEIDMLEGSAQGDNDFSASAHSANHYPGHGERTGTVTVANAQQQYHTYSLAWTPDKLQFMVDGKTFKTVLNPHTGFQNWPYDQRYHLIMNIALGGTQSQNLITPQHPYGIDDTAAPWQMHVQSISYYPLNSPQL